MGEITEMMEEGILCQQCGVYLNIPMTGLGALVLSLDSALRTALRSKLDLAEAQAAEAVKQCRVQVEITQSALACVEALKACAPSWLPEGIRDKRRQALAAFDRATGHNCKNSS